MNAELQAVFLDRDGTIGGDGWFSHPRDFVLYPGVAQAIKLLRTAGVRVLAFTQQHRVARGEATENEFLEQFAAFGFDGGYLCTHELHENCDCRKPRIGLLLRAAREHGLDLARCAVVGDRGDRDMMAAAALGAAKVLVLTGLGESSLGEYRHTWAGVEPDYVARDVLDAVRWLLESRGRP